MSDDELKTARVPTNLVDVFKASEEVVSQYFRDQIADPARGCIEIGGDRYILVRAAALSVEFFSLVEKLYGGDRESEAHDFARNILFDLAHAIGKSDAKNIHDKLDLTDPVARLSAGPIHFSHSGWAFVDIDPASEPKPGPGFLLLYDHPFSFESDAWMRADRPVDFPVCIMNAGYSSGWCEESFGVSLVASEVLCRAKGDDCCRFIMAPPNEIEGRVEAYIAGEPALASRLRGYQIPDFFARKRTEEELRAARDELEKRVADRTRDLRLANERLRREMRNRERIQEQLQNTQRLESLGRLAGGIAHDFNNLLGVVIGYSSILQRRVSPDEPMHGMLGEITEAAQLAAQLTKQLLTFSRAQVASKRRVDLNEVVATMTNMLRSFLGDDIRLQHRLASKPAIIVADRSQLEQLLLNLAVNARDAMPDGGALKIETRVVDRTDQEPGAVHLVVSDTGTGMDPVTRSRIFEPFFTTKEGGEGTGLGLSTVYGIVTQAGGSITVDSEPHLGTEFHIVLPKAEGVPEDSPMLDAQRSLTRSRGETVLLVEDRVGFRALVANLLGDSGYKVLVAHDTDDALRIAEQHPTKIHLLLTDVVMPRVSGRVLAERVRELQPGIRVLFMSGHHDATSRKELESGRSGFLLKPFTPRDLDRELRRLLD
jgi:signal transduction histidine kinase